MPKQAPNAHFDTAALLEAVHQQDIGLRISTNNPEHFKQLMYKEAARSAKRLKIYSCPRSPKSFLLLKAEPHASK